MYSYLEEVDKDHKTDLLESVQEYDASCSVDTLTNILTSDTFKSHMDTFVDHIKKENPKIKVQMTLKFLLFYLKVLEKSGTLPFTVSYIFPRSRVIKV